MPRLQARAILHTAMLSLATLMFGGAQAAAPQVKTQAPGFYRMMLGDFEVTALSDGTIDLPVDKLLTGAKPGQVQKALQRGYMSLPAETSVNAYLVNIGSKLVLFDTGASTSLVPTLGRLLASLRAAGYQPEQVDEIFITHLHPDHAGGLVDASGKAAFPNATVRFDKRDGDFWLNPATLEKAPEAEKGYIRTAVLAVKPYQEAGRAIPFDGSIELVPGIRAVSAGGHTPGHTTYVVESKGQKLAVWGDLMHVAAVQFPDPAVTMAFDVDSHAARPQRQKAYADAARNGYYVAIAHVSFPGIGRLRAEGKGYAWVPVTYSVKP